MVKLHLRSFQKKAHIAADGTIVFPTATELSEAVIPVGGSLIYESNGTDLQQQIDSTNTNVTSNTTSITTLQSSGHAHVDTFVFVDVGRAGETYTETGSKLAPFRTLSSAVNVKLHDDETDTVVFKLAPGTYVGTISRDKATVNQMFEIHGSGQGNTFIKGSSTWDATTSHVLYFRDFVSITIRDVNISNGAYGIYTRSTPLVIIENCVFANLGSSGVNHGFDRTQVQMAADWASRGTVGSNRSDGGVMRIRSSEQVIIRNCTSGFTLRGYRLQNCNQGRIIGCTARYPLESGFYLASSSYTGATGCKNFIISDCRVENGFNNAYLVIGGSDNSIVNCRAYNCANSAVMGWHTQDLRVLGCILEKSTQLTYNGIGSLGDSWGCIMFSGATALVDTSGYMLTALYNSMLLTGAGRHSEAVGFWFGELDETLTSFRCVIDQNNIDTVEAYKDDSDIPLTQTRYPGRAQELQTTNALSTLTTNVATNVVDIAANVVDIATNTTAISGLTGFSGTADKVVITDGSGDLTTSATDKAKVEYLENVTSDIQAQIDNRVKLDVSQTLSGGELKMYSNANQQFLMQHTGYGKDLKLYSNFGQGGLLWGTNSGIVFDGGRISMPGVMVRPPTGTSDPGDPAATCQGCIYVNTNTAGAYLLKFHNGTSWKTVTTS